MEVQNSHKYCLVTHCIFDMDGLLINSHLLYEKLELSVLKKHCPDAISKYNVDLQAKLMGSKPLIAAEILINGLGIQHLFTPQAWLDACAEDYEIIFPTASILPGVEKLINHLKVHRIPFGISTGSSNAEFNVKATNLKDFFAKFEFIVKCGSDPEVKIGKPAADAFDVARMRFNPVPKAKHCLVFEDAPLGVKSGIAAGMQVIMVPAKGLPDTYRKEATLVLNSMEDFKPELFGLPPY